MSERYFNDTVKEFYELKMGSMIDDEYTSKSLELLRYVPYLIEEKAKIQMFISGLPVAFKDKIEFNEPRSLEEAIWKLKHFCEQSNRNDEPKRDLKGNEKVNGKWILKQEDLSM